MKEKIIRFMQGRYGEDEFNRFMNTLAIVLFFISILFDISFLWYVALILITIVFVRMFSRNIPKRYAENQKFLTTSAPLRRWLQLKKKHMKERKTHRFFTCPSCKQKVRVPKGKGMIQITCPKCRTQFQKRS